MDEILLYDIGDGKESCTTVFKCVLTPSWKANWHNQMASGQVPETRRKFCGGVIWAQDQSSYNV